jgi:hypothetical protein
VAFLSRALTEIFEELFDVRKPGGRNSKAINRPQALGFDLKQNQSALGAAQVSREDHVE